MLISEGWPTRGLSVARWTMPSGLKNRRPVADDLRMRRLRHGYTNHTAGDGVVVEKTYAGPDAELRLDREHSLLTRLQGRLPVPPVRAADAGTLTLGFVPGVQGQELLDAGDAGAVLETCGRVLRRVHGITPSVLGGGGHAAGKVLVHGDFGPNNVLFDPVTFEATAVIDWEFAHLGDPVEDLAWCESLEQFCHRWEPNGPGVRQWRERAAATAAWHE